MVAKILEGTFTAILAFLVVNNWYAFTQVVSSVGGTYVNGVKVLQGR